MPLKFSNKKHSNPQESPIRLINDSRFCVKFVQGCATWITLPSCQSEQKNAISLAEKVLFAVKTCRKFHDTRLPIISQTWAKAALNIEYFSEHAEREYETKQLPGIRKIYDEFNLCKKTYAIINYFNKHAFVKGWKWLVIADDDTLLSVHKVLQVLNCYNPEKPLVIGQRYGFQVAEGKDGYDFIAGGGGMVFSRAMTLKIIEDENKYGKSCSCPSADYPDDMYLTGQCISKLNSSLLVHNDGFHQGSPSDYTLELLQHRNIISFHKFWDGEDNISTTGTTTKRKWRWNFPTQIYESYFKTSDEYLVNYKSTRKMQKQEL